MTDTRAHSSFLPLLIAGGIGLVSLTLMQLIGPFRAVGMVGAVILLYLGFMHPMMDTMRYR